jgi:hypothetical protein
MSLTSNRTNRRVPATAPTGVCQQLCSVRRQRPDHEMLPPGGGVAFSAGLDRLTRLLPCQL